MVYIQEAHPEDGWQTDSNVAAQIVYRQPKTSDEREHLADACRLGLSLSVPIPIEEMDNAIDEAYGAAPNRGYVVGLDGKVWFRGGVGPHFFDLDEWERAIETCVKEQVSGRSRKR